MTLVLVDLSAVWWRNWHVQRDGDPPSAAHDRTVAFVRQAVEGNPAGVCCDAKSNWRRDACPTYKAGRAERPPEAWAQLEHVKDTLRREGLPVWECDGFEADDIIATAVGDAKQIGPDDDIAIVTNDKDLFQLLRPGVTVQTLGDQRQRARTVTHEDCAIGGEKVAPSRVRDFLALAGDGSDNVPGVRGVGPKGAVKLLGMFGSFIGVVAAIESDDPRIGPDTAIGKALRAGLVDAKVSWMLVELRTDAPISVADAFAERVPQAPHGSEGFLERAPKPDPEEVTGERVMPSVTGTVEGDRLSSVIRSGDELTFPGVDGKRQVGIVRAADAVPWELQLEPRNGSEAWELASQICTSRLYPMLTTPAHVLTAILLGRAHRLPAAIACANAVPIKGRLAMTAQFILGIVLRSELCEYLECVEANESAATYIGKRRGRPERELTFTIEQAIRAGYTNTKDGGVMGRDGMYYKDTETMLVARCGTRAARRWWPDVVTGMYSVDELGDDS